MLKNFRFGISSYSFGANCKGSRKALASIELELNINLCVDLHIGKILVDAEEVFQVGDVLTNPCYFSEYSRCVGIVAVFISIRPSQG